MQSIRSAASECVSMTSRDVMSTANQRDELTLEMTTTWAWTGWTQTHWPPSYRHTDTLTTVLQTHTQTHWPPSYRHTYRHTDHRPTDTHTHTHTDTLTTVLQTHTQTHWPPSYRHTDRLTDRQFNSISNLYSAVHRERIRSTLWQWLDTIDSRLGKTAGI